MIGLSESLVHWRMNVSTYANWIYHNHANTTKPHVCWSSIVHQIQTIAAKWLLFLLELNCRYLWLLCAEGMRVPSHWCHITCLDLDAQSRGKSYQLIQSRLRHDCAKKGCSWEDIVRSGQLLDALTLPDGEVVVLQLQSCTVTTLGGRRRWIERRLPK